LWVVISTTLDIDFCLFVCFLCVFFRMNMSSGCAIVALVFEDVHYGVKKLVVYQRPKKMWNTSEFK
jgi:hypothetical protein